MNRLATLAMTTVSLFVGVALLAVDGIGYAQQRSDSDNVNAAVNAFHAALSNLDIGKMQNVWAQEPYVASLYSRVIAISSRRLASSSGISFSPSRKNAEIASVSSTAPLHTNT
jgi:hypothetical protein